MTMSNDSSSTYQHTNFERADMNDISALKKRKYDGILDETLNDLNPSKRLKWSDPDKSAQSVDEQSALRQQQIVLKAYATHDRISICQIRIDEARRAVDSFMDSVAWSAIFSYLTKHRHYPCLLDMAYLYMVLRKLQSMNKDVMSLFSGLVGYIERDELDERYDILSERIDKMLEKVERDIEATSRLIQEMHHVFVVGSGRDIYNEKVDEALYQAFTGMLQIFGPSSN
ncbi:unnamed protein product [Periconia digitata]|uniref:Uncharacterized protein n=1 Tax=Periconia digitata TaxID=1303443 RepID=A0A9W4UUS2_9PLEO|nr:unnamed protein product [Periconia digitata]